MIWEGAEICYYATGESYTVGLSDVQFAVVAKILGLSVQKDGTVNCYSDETLKQFTQMNGNPLRLREV